MLKLVLLQDAGNDGGQNFGLSSVSVLSGQYIGLRVCLHSVSMFGYNDIVQPAGHALEAAVCTDAGFFLFLRAVTQLPPVFRLNNALLCYDLACLVLLEDLSELFQLLLTYNRLGRHGFKFWI